MLVDQWALKQYGRKIPSKLKQGKYKIVYETAEVYNVAEVPLHF